MEMRMHYEKDRSAIVIQPIVHKGATADSFQWKYPHKYLLFILSHCCLQLSTQSYLPPFFVRLTILVFRDQPSRLRKWTSVVLSSIFLCLYSSQSASFISCFRTIFTAQPQIRQFSYSLDCTLRIFLPHLLHEPNWSTSSTGLVMERAQPSPTPSPPQSLRRNEFRTWWADLSSNAKIVCSLMALVVGGFSSIFFFKIVFGVLNFVAGYLRAAVWDDLIEDSCGAISRESFPLWSLSYSDYLRWNRCWGNDIGFERIVDIFIAVQYFLCPLGRAPVLVKSQAFCRRQILELQSTCDKYETINSRMTSWLANLQRNF